MRALALFLAAMLVSVAADAASMALYVPLYDVAGNPLAQPDTAGTNAIRGCTVIARKLDDLGAPSGADLVSLTFTSPPPGSSQDLGQRCPAVGKVMWAAFCWNDYGTSEMERMDIDCPTPRPVRPTLTDPNPSAAAGGAPEMPPMSQ